jgi:hypothetical protein
MRTRRRKEGFGTIGLGEHAQRRPSLRLMGSHATFMLKTWLGLVVLRIGIRLHLRSIFKFPLTIARDFLKHVIYKLSRWWISLCSTRIKFEKENLPTFLFPKQHIFFQLQNPETIPQSWHSESSTPTLYVNLAPECPGFISESLKLITSSRTTHAQLPSWQLQRQTTSTLRSSKLCLPTVSLKNI